MYFIFLSFRLCFVILPCLFNPAFHAAILNKPLIDRQRDRRTDRQTSCHCKVRGMNARRAVNVYEKIAIFSTNISLYLRNDTIGDRAFCFAGPRVWNSLSSSTQNAPSLPVFRRLLKCELFRRCYGSHLC